MFFIVPTKEHLSTQYQYWATCLVASAKLLGVILLKCLRFDEHVRYITAICAQRMYLLILKS